MNTTRKIAYLSTSILLSSVLAGYGRTLAAATIAPTPNASLVNTANSLTSHSLASINSATPTVVAQATARIHNRGNIKFLLGQTYAKVDGYLAPQNIDRYRFRATAGQHCNLSVRSPNQQVLLTLIDPNGNPIVRYQSGAADWSGKLPANGTYQLDVVNQSRASSYNLRLSIR